MLLALPSAWRDRRTVAATRFLLAWVVPSWLVFEAAQTKLPHYTLPLFPALMLLGAAWAMDPLRRMPRLARVALGGGGGAACWWRSASARRRWRRHGSLRMLPWEALLVLPWRRC